MVMGRRADTFLFLLQSLWLGSQTHFFCFSMILLLLPRPLQKNSSSEILRAMASLCHRVRECGDMRAAEGSEVNPTLRLTWAFPFTPWVSEFMASSHSFPSCFNITLPHPSCSSPVA